MMVIIHAVSPKTNKKGNLKDISNIHVSSKLKRTRRLPYILFFYFLNDLVLAIPHIILYLLEFFWFKKNLSTFLWFQWKPKQTFCISKGRLNVPTELGHMWRPSAQCWAILMEFCKDYFCIRRQIPWKFHKKILYSSKVRPFWHVVNL